MKLTTRLYRALRRRTAPGPKRNDTARWGVVATVREPLDLIVPFVCHHLAQGAEMVILYLDDPHDPAAPILERIEGVKLVRCTDAYWRREGFQTRSTIQNERQITNLKHALVTTHLDWIMHLDADEFLWLPEGMGPEIAGIAPTEDWLAIRPAERIWDQAPRPDLFGGLFRDRLSDEDAVRRVYGDEAPFLVPVGLAGYPSFKPLLPARTRHHAMTHKLMDRDGTGPRPSRLSDQARVLHFEGLTPIHWALKQLRYAAQSSEKIIVRTPRYLAIREIIAADDVRQAALDRFDRTYVFDKTRLAHLQQEGALIDAPIDIPGAMARHAPFADLDLTGARIDAALSPLLDQVAADVTARRAELLDVEVPIT